MQPSEFMKKKIQVNYKTKGHYPVVFFIAWGQAQGGAEYGRRQNRLTENTGGRDYFYLLARLQRQSLLRAEHQHKGNPTDKLRRIHKQRADSTQGNRWSVSLANIQKIGEQI